MRWNLFVKKENVMYRPSMYNKHDESMYAFVELFNNCKVCNDVETSQGNIFGKN